ncbi:MAG: hypothetical protein JWM76_2071, partial [Pseudonocardiales bacterium]|nr:hypothetical protein [Pseudonocardiales bacterium]
TPERHTSASCIQSWRYWRCFCPAVCVGTVGRLIPRSQSSEVDGFDFEFESSYLSAARIFGIRPDNARLTLTVDHLSVRFGPWRVETARSNVASAVVTGPYSKFKTLGPARLSILTHSLTFATNHRQGVEIRFHEPIAGIEPTGRIRHPNLTVTVTDCARLAGLFQL